MRRSESNLIKRRGSYESPSSRLRRALSLSSSAAPVGRRRSDPPPIHCRSSNSLGKELQNKPKYMSRLRSAQSLALRSSRSSRDSLLGSAPSHHQHRHRCVSGGPNAVFDTISDKRPPIKSSPPTTGSSPYMYYARINLRYKNDCGRAVAIATARAVHHDIKMNRILNVTIPYDGLASLELSEDIEWIDRMGAIYFVNTIM